MALNDRERLFVDEYIKLGNAYQAALQAGYAEQTAKEAHKWIRPPNEAPKNPDVKSKFKPEVRAAIDARMAEKEKELIADQDEILRYLTSVMRGQTQAEVVVVENTGDFSSRARTMRKAPDEKERLKAAELLGKRYGLYTENVSLEGPAKVVIVDDLADE